MSALLVVFMEELLKIASALLRVGSDESATEEERKDEATEEEKQNAESKQRGKLKNKDKPHATILEDGPRELIA